MIVVHGSKRSAGLKTRRTNYEYKLFDWVNRQRVHIPALINANSLGYCVLSWDKNTWQCKWFDKAMKSDEKDIESI